MAMTDAASQEGRITMPPHCDSMAGPVVTAARKALDAKDVRIILPYVPAEGEPEVAAAF
jgi:hypothetical protein